MGKDRLDDHLKNITSALGGSGEPTSADKLDWYLSNITSLIESGGGAGGMDYQVCPNGLPQEGQKGIIYLVPDGGSKTKNVYDEYIWVNNDFECIGSTKADLSGYEVTTNKVTSLSVSSTDTQYPSAKAVYDQLATKQATLVNQSNIKSINGNSLLGSGNIDIVSKHTFPNTWTTNSTTETFCSAIVDDNSAVPGMIYMGKLMCSDLPGGLGQGEATVEIISKDANGKAIRITLTSVDTAPYRWEYERAKINSVYRNTGWVGYQPEIKSSNKLSSDLVDDSNHTNKFVTASDKTTWSGKQDALISGTNIKTINNTSILGNGNINTKELPVSLGTAGQVLKVNSDATGVEWANESGGGAGMTNPMTTAGDIIIGGSSGAPSRLGIGTNGQVLTSDGTTASWQTPSGGGSLQIAGGYTFEVSDNGANGGGFYALVYGVYNNKLGWHTVEYSGLRAPGTVTIDGISDIPQPGTITNVSILTFISVDTSDLNSMPDDALRTADGTLISDRSDLPNAVHKLCYLENNFAMFFED